MHNVLPCLAVALLAATSLGCGPVQREPVVANKVPAKIEAFEYGRVTLRAGPLKDAFERNRQYLHTLTPDRYLWTFRKTADLPTPDEPYGGWEAPKGELRGHSIGHYLSACARVIAQDGDTVLRKNADYTVAELAKCQAKHPGGYLSAYPEEFFDRLEAREKVWAPYYTMHKIMLGLWEMYACAGNVQALEVLKKMADYFKGRCDKLDDEHMQRVLGTEFGGMQEVLLNLYASTGEQKYLDFARRFEHRSFVDPLREGTDNLAGRHANTHIPKIAGEARAYELTADPAYRKTVEFFWDRVATTRSYATGGSNRGEHWGKPDELAGTLGAHNQEFCTSYNWQKVCRYLLRWTGDARYADMLERSFYNGILVSQHPETGMLIYFLPLGTGFRKGYGSPFATFTCCYGTGIQAYASLAEDIYFRSADALYVNLYAPSEVVWDGPGGEVRVSQATEYPDSGHVRLKVDVAKPAEFTLALRIPWWTAGDAAVTINGKPYTDAGKAKPGSWLPISRQWSDGDAVELTLPMSLHAEAINDDPSFAAVMYGPLVLAGLLEETARKPDYPTPVFTGGINDLARWIEVTAAKPVTFRTRGQPIDVTFIPIHRVVDEPYGVYWRFGKPGSKALAEFEAAIERIRSRERRIIDSVAIGDAESEKAHDLKGKNTQSGPHQAGTWRHAGKGGFFSYRLQVDSKADAIVAVTYWGDDTGDRIFDILVDGERIATQRLNKNKPGRLFVVEYPVPRNLTEGKTAVVIRFEPSGEGTVAGGVFGLAVLHKE